MVNVVKLNEYKAVKQYQQLAKCSNFDLRLDDVVRPVKKDYAKLLQSGYMKLLSNYKG